MINYTEENKFGNENKNKPKSLKELLKNDNSLKLFRYGNLGMNGKDGISFYGISKFGIKSYSNSGKNQLHIWILPEELTNKIVDLHLPENRKKIQSYIEQNPNIEKLMTDTLFSMYGDLGNKVNNLPNNNRRKLSRHSENSTQDRKMVKELKKIFPEAIGSYTQIGYGLSHSEVIIWEPELNNILHSGDMYYVKSKNNQNRSSKRRRVNTTPTTPVTPVTQKQPNNSYKTPPPRMGKLFGGKIKKSKKNNKNKSKSKSKKNKKK